ncbi:hypothetical protein QJS04_geneDACA019400 [Acorus gramineus]|uniref:Elongation factor Ts, mitochondrial n=1 Tax=Acorus gramineus TaxID=55184 RepID=A0AAV9AMD9_ACOGR|nr:hypothetical protein QJS04_geneDACA019400 [Acorus gramineus]
MTAVFPCSIGNVALFPQTTFIPRKGVNLPKPTFYGLSTKLTPSQKFQLSKSIALRLLQKRSRIQILSAVPTDVAVDINAATSATDAEKTSEPSPTTTGASKVPSVTSHSSPTQKKHQRPMRKSEMPPVKSEELKPGASFMGKVRSIQPFGAFVDFGAFTDGLIHVSKMSDGFVKDVGSILSIGQEVKVRIVEANFETRRISLTMRENDDVKPQQSKEPTGTTNNDRPKSARRNSGKPAQKQKEAKKATKFMKGQVLDGTVKNLTRSGAFISLPEGEEGFLPQSEVAEVVANIMGTSSLQVGQEVNVRVLRISRGQVTLTMKKEENMEELNMKLNQGVVHKATNPFFLAFRKNKEIASFLDEMEKLKSVAETKTETVVHEVEDSGIPGGVPDKDGILFKEVIEEEMAGDSTDKKAPIEEAEVIAVVEIKTEPEEENISLEEVGKGEEDITVASLNAEAAILTVKEEASTGLLGENDVSVSDPVIDEGPVTDEVKEASDAVALSDASVPNEVIEVGSVVDPSADTSDTISESVEPEEVVSSETAVLEDTVSNEAEEATMESNLEVVSEKPLPVEDEIPPVVASENGPSIPDENGGVISGGERNDAPQESVAKATISPALVKQLREETGAGMMDCKKALSETGGDITKAQEFLRKKGLASADKKASRATAEGRIGSYIHDNRIGILIEVNCETDFVSRGEIFKELVDDLAMQAAAYPQVQYLVTEDVPEETVNKEREIEMQKEDLLNKPEQIWSKIVEGRIKKRLDELALLEQPYIKNDKVLVKDWVKQTIATVGENIKVKRFVRFNLGEGLEKKSQDFAAEVAAQTETKVSPTVSMDPPSEVKEVVEKAPTVAISAALVKQLREETGAGMMDCKKALTETTGDLEKAQEYLRKKGLSSADKKSSRLAAEGRISSYIHDARIGVLLEVNCETDFVGRSEKFQELSDDLAMQIVACPQVKYVSIEEIPESIKNKEWEIEMGREDLKSKPENVREKIVEGRVSKRLGELALLEQPFIKDDGMLVKDLVKQTVAALGENIRVRRFVRFTLGETTEVFNEQIT